MSQRCLLSRIIEKLEELGYPPIDFDTQYDEKEWIWSSLVNQVRPLTDRGTCCIVQMNCAGANSGPLSGWNNIRPKLEETLRLRKDAREIRERQERIDQQEKRILALASIVVGNWAYVGRSQVLDLPRAKELVHKDDAKYVMAENDLQSLVQDIRELNKTRKKQVIRQYAAELVAARHDCGLSGFPEGINVNEQAESDIDEAVLHHPTSLCVFDDKVTITYARVSDISVLTRQGTMIWIVPSNLSGKNSPYRQSFDGHIVRR